MLVRELIKRLKQFNPDDEVTILDGFNGGGDKRIINLGPIESTIGEEDECDDNSRDTIVTMGYGCY